MKTLGKKQPAEPPPPAARGPWEALSIELQHKEQLHKAVRQAILDIEIERFIARSAPRSPVRD